MNASDASTPRSGRSSGFSTSALPELHRSEAFVDDLFDCSGFRPERQSGAPANPRWMAWLLCGVPLLLALLGGLLAFFGVLG